MSRASRPVGTITRGTTHPNRLRRVDRWIAHAGGRALRAAADPVVVDLGADLPSEVTLVNATAASSVVVRTHTRLIAAAVLRSPSATDVGAVSPSAADLVELPIAPYGSAVLTLS